MLCNSSAIESEVMVEKSKTFLPEDVHKLHWVQASPLSIYLEYRLEMGVYQQIGKRRQQQHRWIFKTYYTTKHSSLGKIESFYASV